MNKHISKFFLIITIVCLAFTVGCSSEVSLTTTSTSTSTTGTVYSDTTRSIESDEDSYSEQDWDLTVYVNLSDGTWSTDNSTYNTSTIESTLKISTASDGLITINCKEYEGDINFIISGSVTNGSLLIKKTADYDVGLYLNGVSISSGNYPCIEVKGEVKNTFVYLNGTNTLVDGRSYGTGYSEEEGTDYYTSTYSGTPDEDAELTKTWALGSDSKGTLYSKGSLILSGNGSLSITQNYKHCIASKDYVRIISGTYKLSSTSGRDGIRAVNGFIMDGGSLTINVSGSNTNNESRGIVVEGEESTDTPSEGYIIINGGTIEITSYSKAITAKWDIEDDATTTDTSDDPNPYVLITGGTITITTTGNVVEETSATYSIVDANGVTTQEAKKCSPEGIEGKRAVYIQGGTIYINSTDDSINASYDGEAEIVFSGGYVHAKATQQDCIDSNGDITISGGVVYAISTSNDGGAFDCDGTLSITGGTVLGLYSGNGPVSTPSSSACTQGALVISASNLGTSGTFAIKDSSSNVVFAADISSSYSNYTAIISASGLKKGSTYTLYSGTTATGGTAYNGLYYSLPTVSGGTNKGSITLSSYVYSSTSGTSSRPGNVPGFH